MATHHLNPYGMPDIAPVVDASKSEQLWFFLDDSIPTPGHPTDVVFISDEPCAYVCAMTDMCFFSTANGQGLDSEHAHMIPYMPLLQNCCRPYVWTAEPDDMTPQQEQLYAKMQAAGHCRATVDTPTGPSIPVDIWLGAGPDLQKEISGWLVP